jgi:hypothetical protein
MPENRSGIHSKQTPLAVSRAESTAVSGYLARSQDRAKFGLALWLRHISHDRQFGVA